MKKKYHFFDTCLSQTPHILILNRVGGITSDIGGDIMKPSIINHFDNMPAQVKKAYLTYLCASGYDSDDQRIRTGLTSLLTDKEDDDVRAIAIQLLGDSVDENDVRDSLKALLPILPKNSTSYDFMKSLLITALSDEMEEVRAWGIELIREYEKINPENNSELFDFLARNLDNENAALHLRWHCMLGLAQMGTRQAADKLLVFGKKLLLTLPDSDEHTPDKFLAEKTAYSIGLAAEKICGYGKKQEAILLLERIAMRLASDGNDARTVSWAIGRINESRCTPVSCAPAVVPFIKSIRQLFTQTFSFKFAGAIAAVCLVLIVARFPDRFDEIVVKLTNSPREFDEIGVKVSMRGIRENATSTMRGSSSPGSGEFDVTDGGILKSGDYFSVSFKPDKNAYIRVLLYDSSKEITELFSDKAYSDKNILISTTKQGEKLQLDDIPGTETVYILASKNPIENFDKKLNELRKIGMDKIQQVFPNISIQTFRFRHE
ncbi:MAG TPA: hypothetical protein DCQ37_16160 [Desulfobacteraceae bacterium]|nr:hypothetical protein [Desulfobacteraceae bacterium]